MWICLKVVLLGGEKSQFPFVRIPIVQFKSFTKHDQQGQHDPAETARPLSTESAWVREKEWSEPDRMLGKVLCLTSLNEAKISKDSDQWIVTKLAMQAPVTDCLSPIYILFKHHVPSHASCLSKTPRESVSAKHHMSMHHMTQLETSTLCGKLGGEATTIRGNWGACSAENPRMKAQG